MLWDGSTDKDQLTRMQKGNGFHAQAKRNFWLSWYYSLKKWTESAMTLLEKSLFGAIEKQNAAEEIFFSGVLLIIPLNLN